jgi:predicted ArsR family transcriptional regulator
VNIRHRERAHYPHAPGFQPTDTSIDAAERVDATTLRIAVLRTLALYGPMTADQCAHRLGESVLAIRPRFTELKIMGRLIDTGQRERNQSGRRAIVWRRTS